MSAENSDDRFKLMEHQKDALMYLDCNGSLGIFAEMGLGKTVIALTYASRLLKKGEIKDILVICPASLVPSWEKAIFDMLDFEGFDEFDVWNLYESTKIRSFQRMYRSTYEEKKHRNGQTSRKKYVQLREDVDKHWGLLIVDESHGVGSHSSIQTKAAIELSKLSDRRVIMSGTPFHGGKGRPAYEKMYGQFQILSQGKEWRSWKQFCDQFVTRFDLWYKPVEFREDLCKQKIQEYSVTYRLADCIDMPEKVEQTIPCPLIEKRVYTDIRKGDIAQYYLDIESGGGFYNKLLQICSGSLITDKGVLRLKSSKEEVLTDILNGTEDPVVIFCNFRASVDRCEDIAKKTGRTVTVYDGRSKKNTWEDFQNGKYDTIVCQYQSGGVGLNLQRAHTMVLYEPCLSALLLEQAKGRIYRKGQEQKCVYYYLSTPNAIEEKVFESVRKGTDVSNAMLEEFAHSEE